MFKYKCYNKRHEQNKTTAISFDYKLKYILWICYTGLLVIFIHQRGPPNQYICILDYFSICNVHNYIILQCYCSDNVNYMINKLSQLSQPMHYMSLPYYHFIDPPAPSFEHLFCNQMFIK